MANCCNLKCLSWATAILHVVLGFIMIIVAALCVSAPKSAYDDAEFEMKKNYILAFFIGLLIYSLLVFGSAITLIVGLKKDRHQLFQPFIYVIYVGMVFTIITATRMFFWGIKAKKPVGKLALELFTDFLFVGFQGLLLAPVYFLYKRMRGAPGYLPEQHALSNNEPVNKPYYPVQSSA